MGLFQFIYNANGPERKAKVLCYPKKIMRINTK